MQPVKGFTLIEVMVTIAVLAVIAMIAVPSFSNMMLRQNLNSSADHLIATFSQARAKAVLERRSITVNLGTQAQANTDNVLNWAPSGKTVRVSSKINSIGFRADGLIQDPENSSQILSTNINIQLCDQANSANSSKIITINFLGNIRDTGLQDAKGCS